MFGALLFIFLLFIIFSPFCIIILIIMTKNSKYKESTYYKVTQTPFFTVCRDSGKYGEYLTYNYLKNYEALGSKFLFNLYIPKENNETTEIDVLLISQKGIFVFESKNYSGWIFGSENQKTWTQTLPTGYGKSSKNHFFNPIIQNRSHIKHLKNLIGDHVPMYSIIVFSDRCTLKNISITSKDVNVINRYKVNSLIASAYKHIPNNVINDVEINDIYNKLYPYTQVSEQTKLQHIANINSKK